MVIESLPNQSNDAEPQARICLACKHFSFSSGSPGYSSWTPGSPGHVECDKRHWNGTDMSAEEFFAANMMAKTCVDYTLSKLAIKHGFTE